MVSRMQVSLLMVPGKAVEPRKDVELPMVPMEVARQQAASQQIHRQAHCHHASAQLLLVGMVPAEMAVPVVERMRLEGVVPVAILGQVVAQLDLQMAEIQMAVPGAGQLTLLTAEIQTAVPVVGRLTLLVEEESQ